MTHVLANKPAIIHVRRIPIRSVMAFIPDSWRTVPPARAPFWLSGMSARNLSDEERARGCQM